MNNKQIKPCAFCGQMPRIFGQKVRDYVDGEWSEYEREEYWVQPFCFASCEIGNIYSKNTE